MIIGFIYVCPGSRPVTMNHFVAALDAVLEEEIVAGGSPRWNAVKATCRKIRQNSANPTLATSARTIVCTVESCVNHASDAKAVAFRREKAFSSFHEVATIVLPLYWEAMIASVGDPLIDYLFTQSVNQKIFDAVFEKAVEVGKVEETLSTPALNEAERNVLRYIRSFCLDEEISRIRER